MPSRRAVSTWSASAPTPFDRRPRPWPASAQQRGWRRCAAARPWFVAASFATLPLCLVFPARTRPRGERVSPRQAANAQPDPTFGRRAFPASLRVNSSIVPRRASICRLVGASTAPARRCAAGWRRRRAGAYRVGTDRQPGGQRDLIDQAPRILLPAVFGHATGVPSIEQSPQLGRRVPLPAAPRHPRRASAPASSDAGQRRESSWTNHVALVLKPRQVVGVCPAWADHSHADRALSQCRIDLVAPLADADAVRAKDALPPEPDAQPVVKTTTAPRASSRR